MGMTSWDAAPGGPLRLRQVAGQHLARQHHRALDGVLQLSRCRARRCSSRVWSASGEEHAERAHCGEARRRNASARARDVLAARSQRKGRESPPRIRGGSRVLAEAATQYFLLRVLVGKPPAARPPSPSLCRPAARSRHSASGGSFTWADGGVSPRIPEECPVSHARAALAPGHRRGEGASLHAEQLRLRMFSARAAS